MLCVCLFFILIQPWGLQLSLIKLSYVHVCIYIFRRIAQFTRCIAGLFTKLMFIFVRIFMLFSLSAFVRFLLKKLFACLTRVYLLEAYTKTISIRQKNIQNRLEVVVESCH